MNVGNHGHLLEFSLKKQKQNETNRNRKYLIMVNKIQLCVVDNNKFWLQDNLDKMNSSGRPVGILVTK